jgi:uncharacterized membrane protein YbhN (UPF0104 family)
MPWLSGLVTVLLAIIALMIVLIAVPKILHALEGGNPWWALLATLCVVGSVGGFCLAFTGAYRGRGNLAGAACVEAGLTQKGAATFLPGGQAGAAGAIAVVLRRTGMTSEELADRGVALLVLVHAPYFLGILGVGLVVGTGVVDLSVAPAFIWSATVVAGLVVLAAVLVALLVRPAVSGQPDPHGFRERTRQLVRACAGGVRSAVGLVRIPAAVVGTLIYVSLDCGTLVVAMHIFGQNPPLISVIMAWLMAQVVSLIPVPAGIGTVDAGVLGTLVVFGQSAQDMAAPTIAYHALSLAIPAIAGGIGFLLLRRRLVDDAVGGGDPVLVGSAGG